MAYSALSLRNRGVPFLSRAYLVRLNRKYFVTLAYLSVCATYVLRIFRSGGVAAAYMLRC